MALSAGDLGDEKFVFDEVVYREGFVFLALVSDLVSVSALAIESAAPRVDLTAVS